SGCALVIDRIPACSRKKVWVREILGQSSTQCFQSGAVVDSLKENRCAESAAQNEKSRCSRKVEDAIQTKGIFSLFGEFQLILADDERCESAAIRRFYFDEACDLIWLK